MMGKMCLVIVLLVVGMFSTVIAMDSPKPTKLSQYDFTEANNQFALDLYLKLSNNKGNIFFSPYSIS
ncbi:MAG: hypothetical protein J7K36_00530, partial [Archaeoglobaceae archaeon]|nr:hypothetical protein [Archaeoglobaceae archaeon]